MATAVASLLFALAIIHTFVSGLFERLAHSHPRHAGLWHLLGEVEVVFGFWAMVLLVFMFVGEDFLRLLNLSDLSLQMAGGVVLFLIALRMVFPPPSDGQAAVLEGLAGLACR